MFRSIVDGMASGNFSAAILIVGIFQLAAMIYFGRRKK